ncbi:hypothetical protein TL16_g13156 [Triparma laevis f. inornata]|uniref:AB hydrolase-1 domain-containing protein n=1 Tax=Triparma laevis f. inornata TaxID=1714386 RepID=A0A9W7BWK0_9STRA|nr:hypothetical protein TL16_g13156 [Triparma laevis f. inornata]
MLAWRERFCEDLAAKGFYVIRFDNRDIGLSKHFDELGPPPLVRRVIFNAICGRWFKIGTPYGLEDMARDSFGLLTALGFEKAHLVGASMGGMIAQTMAIMDPDRVLSLCSIMSTTGARNLPDGETKVRMMLLKKPGPTHEDRVNRTIDAITMISSPQLPSADLASYAERVITRSYHPEGATRQMNAIIAQADRSKDLGGLKMPCVVIHGRGDRLVPVAHGEATAAAIGGDVGLVIVDNMGHVVVQRFNETVISAIVWNAGRGMGRGSGEGLDISDLDLSLE